MGYGNIAFAVSSGTTIQRYYERKYGGTLGYSFRLRTKEGSTGWKWSHSFFYERRDPLLGYPDGAVGGIRNIRDTVTNQVLYFNVSMLPEKGNQWGTQASLTYSSPMFQDPQAPAPHSGGMISASAEYTPKKWGSDFSTLTTVLTGKKHWELARHISLAQFAAAGLQWFDTFYLRTFRLGGAFGEGPFSSIDRRSYSLRGLPAGYLRGEGILTTSQEFRFPLLKLLKGFGTAPFWIKNFHAAIFGDGGQTFERKNFTTYTDIFSTPVKKFSWNRFSLSSGAELKSDLSIGYAPPLTFRLGYGYVLFNQGDWIASSRLDEVYLQIGSTF